MNNISYNVRTGPSTDDVVTLSSLYVIADGGYIEWSQIMTGFGMSSDPMKYRFTDWVASVRKDVECFFGILKQRFRFFKNPITLHEKEDVDNAFFTACILNNMILIHDGLDKLWEDSANWKKIDPDGDETSNEDSDSEDDDLYRVTYHSDPDFNCNIHIEDLIVDDAVQIGNVEQQRFQHFRAILAKHLHIMYLEGNLRWPRYKKEILEKDKYNDRIREHFPNTGDIDV